MFWKPFRHKWRKITVTVSYSHRNGLQVVDSLCFPCKVSRHVLLLDVSRHAPTRHAAGTMADQWENSDKNNNKQHNTETNWPCYRCLVFNLHKMTKSVTEWLKFYGTL